MRDYKSGSDASLAAVTRRFEHKFLVPERLLPQLRRVVEPFTMPDSHAARGGENGWRQYTVRSIYFDTPRLTHYHAIEDGLDFRAKPRIRAYGARRADTTVFLEIKRRHGAVVSKQRAPVAFDALPAVLAGARTGLREMANSRENGTHPRSFIFHLRRDALRPVLLVAYDREPHVGALEPSLRVTFDRRLRSVASPRIAGLFDECGARPSLAGSFVLEVKHDAAFGFPVWLRPFIATHGLSRQALSKYWTCGAEQHVAERGLAGWRSVASL